MEAVSRYNATLVERLDITPQAAIFRVRPDGGVFSFQPGQFTVLGLADSAPRLPESEPEEPSLDREVGRRERLLRRAYSISSGSGNRDYLEFYISLVHSGELTPRLFSLVVGDRLFVGEKASGLFTLERARAEARILMVATGTGLAPYMSMLRSHVVGCPTRPVAVLHGAAFSWDLGFRGELEGLSRQCPHFRYLPIITRPGVDTGWQGRTGRLQGWLSRPELAEGVGFALDPADVDVFLCGHPGMVEEGAALLAGMGFNEGSRKEPGNLHFEKFW